MTEKELEDHLVWLACEGRGNSARGKYLNGLSVLELCYQQEWQVEYNLDKTAKFLVTLIDLLGHEGKTYFREEDKARYMIQRIIKQSFGTWLNLMVQKDLVKLATLCEEAVKHALLNPKKSKFREHHRDLNFHNCAKKIPEMPVQEIFSYLEDPSSKAQNPPKHENWSRFLRDTLGPTLDNPYKQAVEDFVTNSNLGVDRHPLENGKFVACIPAYQSALNAIVIALKDFHLVPRGKQEENMDFYDFIIFYELLTCDPSWIPPECYASENYRALLEVIPPEYKRRALELARLDLNFLMPNLVAYLHELLENSKKFPEFHQNQPWYETINLDEFHTGIFAVADYINKQVALKVKANKEIMDSITKLKSLSDRLCANGDLAIEDRETIQQIKDSENYQRLPETYVEGQSSDLYLMRCTIEDQLPNLYLIRCTIDALYTLSSGKPNSRQKALEVLEPVLDLPSFTDLLEGKVYKAGALLASGENEGLKIRFDQCFKDYQENKEIMNSITKLKSLSDRLCNNGNLKSKDKEIIRQIKDSKSYQRLPETYAEGQPPDLYLTRCKIEDQLPNLYLIRCTIDALDTLSSGKPNSKQKALEILEPVLDLPPFADLLKGKVYKVGASLASGENEGLKIRFEQRKKLSGKLPKN